MKRNLKNRNESYQWLFSVHGGHSKDFCEHARGSLISIVKKAINLNMPIYGITEHAPRLENKYLYPEERDKGLTPLDLLKRYEKYCERISELQKCFQDSITLLKGLEIEIVPEDSYVDIMKKLIWDGNIEYIVGSVHWVYDIPFDFSKEEFNRGVKKFGLVKLIKRYYELLRDMVVKLKPEVVGHFDLITCYIPSDELIRLYPKIEKDIDNTLEVIKRSKALLEVNTSGFRKVINRCFPDVYILKKVKEISIP